MEEHFHIFFNRNGGFTGSSNSAEVDSRELELSEAEELKVMIDRSGFFEVLVFDTSFLHMPDQFRYVISIEYMGKHRTLKLGDGNLPDKMRPLINRLLRLARSAGKA